MIFRDGEMVSQGTLDPLFYVRIVVPELLPDSSMVELAAVNRSVVGSSPTQAAYWRSSTVERRSPKP